ncbi:MAG: cell envelope integrity EipB family protein [Alphaproteobacteria bacterium]|nr:cell envelope integrity EipB family protein [Alphaproteobacteria bacterium]
MRSFKKPLKTISTLAVGLLFAAIFGVTCFGVLNAAVLATGTPNASHAAPIIAKTPAVAPTDTSDNGQVIITPHRAMYTLKLAGTRNGSRVSDISGRMLFSWADDCHAWNVQQKMQTRFFYSEGEVSDTVSDLVSREAKDGSSFNFHTRHNGDGKDTTETFHGYANLNLDGSGLGKGEAIYSGDNEKHINLSDALFPAHHTMQLLEHARKGEKFFSVNVFDGADEKGFSQISSFINPAIDSKAVIEKTSSGKENQLSNVRAWPIRMAFFAPNSETGSPDYEMDMTLLENGIIKTMTIDYGDYSMTADLVEVKALSPAKCSAENTVPHS